MRGRDKQTLLPSIRETYTNEQDYVYPSITSFDSCGVINKPWEKLTLQPPHWPCTLLMHDTSVDSQVILAANAVQPGIRCTTQLSTPRRVSSALAVFSYHSTLTISAYTRFEIARSWSFQILNFSFKVSSLLL